MGHPQNIIDTQYQELVTRVLNTGIEVAGRNGSTLVVPTANFTFDLQDGRFPIVLSRKIFSKGVIGEYTALLNGVECVADFEKYGCNYWKNWANVDGTLNLDYSNRLMQNGQFQDVINGIKLNPNGRRHLVSLWDHESVKSGELSLPCCWWNFQFVVLDDTIHLSFGMRSLDIMVGLPSDIILSALILITVAKEVNLKPGTVTFNITNPHIYHNHIEGALELITRKVQEPSPKYNYTGELVKDFAAEQITFSASNPLGAISFPLNT